MFKNDKDLQNFFKFQIKIVLVNVFDLVKNTLEKGLAGEFSVENVYYCIKM